MSQHGPDASNDNDIVGALDGREWPIAVCTVEGQFVWPSEAVLYEGGLVENRRRHMYRHCVFRGLGIDLP